MIKLIPFSTKNAKLLLKLIWQLQLAGLRQGGAEGSTWRKKWYTENKNTINDHKVWPYYIKNKIKTRIRMTMHHANHHS